MQSLYSRQAAAARRGDGDALDHAIRQDDRRIELRAVGLVLALLQVIPDLQRRCGTLAPFPYLDGASIDFEDTIQKQGFTIDNPNAAGSCACGDSFS